MRTMFCRDSCGDITAGSDRKGGAERMSDNCSERDNVYVLRQ